MSKESPKRRRFKIKLRQKRRKKIKKLIKKYQKAKTKKEKEKILAKIRSYYFFPSKSEQLRKLTKK